MLISDYGSGRILDTLDKQYKYIGQICDVEYDAQTFELYHNHFSKEYKSLPNLHGTNTKIFVKQSTESFDIIFDDIFNEL
ncbi:hypothetical protein N8368_02850 [Bacteroidia bacterium]|nr:hypothetical protein [Bacteroidia bacterium]MDB9882439.1 hypothetical protein [Bacteroidia bacterium]MDC1395426.1 hypothetical protein [Bacteroidia bacterium]